MILVDYIQCIKYSISISASNSKKEKSSFHDNVLGRKVAEKNLGGRRVTPIYRAMGCAIFLGYFFG